mgnify:CR=1 FL=1
MPDTNGYEIGDVVESINQLTQAVKNLNEDLNFKLQSKNGVGLGEILVELYKLKMRQGD